MMEIWVDKSLFEATNLPVCLVIIMFNLASLAK